MSRRADIDALERFVEEQQAAGRRLPTADHHLLLIAAGQKIKRVAGASAANAELADDLIAGVALAPIVDHSPRKP